jgi:dihydrofolate reductase
MRKIILSMNVSLDGYCSGPKDELDWLFGTIDHEQEVRVTDFLRTEVDTVLLGRTTYLQQAAAWPKRSGEMAELLNKHAKVVVSRTLHTLEWDNSRSLTGDLADGIVELKRQPGKNIFVSGGATLIASLATLGLIDEYNLVTHPVAIGNGKSPFQGLPTALKLTLLGTRTFDTGAVQHTYRPA